MKDLESMDALESWVMPAIAEATLNEAEDLLTQQVGTDPVAIKLRGDFTTETDLETERRLRQLPTQCSGLPVCDEEFDGEVPEEHTAWVIDPIDGTTNYPNDFPPYAMLLTLMHEGEPVTGITSMPLLCRRITATKGGGAFVNSRRVNIDAGADRPISIVLGPAIASTSGTFPRRWRQLLLSKAGERYPMTRTTGSAGVDLGSITMGAFSGTVTFSPHIWDNAAGVLQISEVGDVVTDPADNPWWHDSVGALAGIRGVHATLRLITDQLGCPETFRG